MSDAPVQFFVPGVPSAWARTATYEGRRLTPKKQRNASGDIKTFAWAARTNRPMIDGPVHLNVTACYQRPKKHKPGKLWPDFKVSRPDIDNIIKLVSDSLNGVIWSDDAQVVSVAGMKIFGDKPGLSIEIRPLSP